MPRFKISLVQFFFPLLIFLLTTSCTEKDPLKIVQNFIHKNGYLLYQKEIQSAGIGTLVGGRPDNMIFVASPEVCFPKEIAGVDTKIFYTKKLNLPSSNHSFYLSDAAKWSIFSLLNSSAPIIDSGSEIINLDGIEIKFENISIEYTDIAMFLQFYEEVLPDICKDYLEQVGLIIQTLRIEKMSFIFYQKNKSKQVLSVDNLQKFIKLNGDIEWSIENKVQLNIFTPKYLGFRLGHLRKVNDHISLWIANNVVNNRYIFKAIKEIKTSKNRISEKVYSVSEENFANIIPEMLIDQNYEK